VPGGLHATAATTSSVSIAWNASSDNVGVAGYHVYRDGKLVGSQTGTSYAATGLGSDTSYSFAVRAYDAAGNLSGAATISAKTNAPPAPPPVTPPPSGGGGPIKPPPAKAPPGSPPPSTGGTVQVVPAGSKGKTTVKVDGKTVSNTGTLNTTYLTNGKHTVTVTTTSPNGTTSIVTHKLMVSNKLNLWQKARNVLFKSLAGNPLAMNTAAWLTTLVPAVAIVAFGVHFIRSRVPLYVRLQKMSRRQ
jgi:hypothetical protein